MRNDKNSAASASMADHPYVAGANENGQLRELALEEIKGQIPHMLRTIEMLTLSYLGSEMCDVADQHERAHVAQGVGDLNALLRHLQLGF